uniref:hypothetical protein n=1 Tax=Nocardia exalbida TaxID=290231 RepID=UPI001FDEF9EF|nr:hypothetical protein [Nocardia exalbida]
MALREQGVDLGITLAGSDRGPIGTQMWFDRAVRQTRRDFADVGPCWCVVGVGHCGQVAAVAGDGAFDGIAEVFP